jgi:hypothetical protein
MWDRKGSWRFLSLLIRKKSVSFFQQGQKNMCEIGNNPVNSGHVESELPLAERNKMLSKYMMSVLCFTIQSVLRQRSMLGDNKNMHMVLETII